MYQKLKELVEFGADIEFNFCGNSYTILPWVDNAISIGLQNNNDDHIYKTFDEMIDNYQLNGHIMRDVLNQIDITFTSGC